MKFAKSALLFGALTATARAFVSPLKSGPVSRSVVSTTEQRMIGSILNMLGGGDLGLISPEKALPGRQQPVVQNMDTMRHYVLGNKIAEVPAGYEVAVYANGCFWGSEKGAWRFPKGIHSTAVGYCGGFTPNPTYEEACSGQTGHTEGVRVVYNPEEVSFVDVMRWFWEAHDPTSGMGQGNDRGTQYRSGIYYFNEDQKQLIEASKQAYEKALAEQTGRERKITTEIAAASDYDKYGGLWYYAEAYHQQYLAKPGARPYCSAQPQGVALPSYDDWCPFPEGSKEREKYRPKLPESFWKEHAPRRGCSVVNSPNEPVKL
jgi:peptide-methionine (S)-S-oxide reductase